MEICYRESFIDLFLAFGSSVLLCSDPLHTVKLRLRYAPLKMTGMGDVKRDPPPVFHTERILSLWNSFKILFTGCWQMMWRNRKNLRFHKCNRDKINFSTHGTTSLENSCVDKLSRFIKGFHYLILPTFPVFNG